MRTKVKRNVSSFSPEFRKQIFGLGIAVTSVLTLLTPLAAKAGVPALIVVRIIEGIFEVFLLRLLQSDAVWNNDVIFEFTGRYFPVHPCCVVEMGAADGAIANGDDSIRGQLCRNGCFNAGQRTVGTVFRLGEPVLCVW